MYAFTVGSVLPDTYCDIIHHFQQARIDMHDSTCLAASGDSEEHVQYWNREVANCWIHCW